MIPQPDQEGLKLKYILSKVDGNPVDPEGDYFIIKLNSKTRWHREASIKAILAYAESVQNDAPKLSEDIIMKYGYASHSIATIDQGKLLDCLVEKAKLIRKDERDKVLDKLKDWIYSQNLVYISTCPTMFDVLDKIEELRTPAPEEP